MMHCFVITGDSPDWAKAVCIAVLKDGVVCIPGELDVPGGKKGEGQPFFVPFADVYMGEVTPPPRPKAKAEGNIAKKF